jgi:hypothetical protein
LSLKRFLSNDFEMDKFERNKNPTIEDMSSNLIDLENGSYIEVQITRLDFLEKITDFVK